MKTDFSFTIMWGSMLTHVAECEAYQTRTPRAMTRCECAGVAFQEIAAKVKDGCPVSGSLKSIPNIELDAQLA